MLVRDIMTTPAFTLPPDTTCHDALHAIQPRGYRHLPIVEANGALVGIVTERDLVRVLPGTHAQKSSPEGAAANKLPLDRIMHREVVTCTPDDAVTDAMRILVVHKFSGLPVVDGFNVVGMISDGDIFRGVLSMLEPPGSVRILVRHVMELPIEYGRVTMNEGLKLLAVGTASTGQGSVTQLCVSAGDIEPLQKTLEILGATVVRVDRIADAPSEAPPARSVRPRKSGFPSEAPPARSVRPRKSGFPKE